MSSLVEDFASRFGWTLKPCNVLVEGTSDVAIITLAASLYEQHHGVSLLGEELGIIAAGIGDAGGVLGVNGRLIAISEVAAVDPPAPGRKPHRFIALYDNDRPGQQAAAALSGTTSRLRKYSDLFLLNPVMPVRGGVDPKALEVRFERENAAFKGLKWEMEDLLGDELLSAFEQDFPAAVINKKVVGGRTHRELTFDGKHQLIGFASSYAELEDVLDVVRLIRALRDYCNLQSSHVIVEA